MPQLKIKGLERDTVKKISRPLIDELQELLQCPRDYFLIEHIDTVFIKDSCIDKGYPIVEVSMFDRGQDIQDKIALIITRYIKAEVENTVDVYFTHLQKSSYYENGEHF
ncbi:MAG: DUF1904 family protein [Bacillota bacterium]